MQARYWRTKVQAPWGSVCQKQLPMQGLWGRGSQVRQGGTREGSPRSSKPHIRISIQYLFNFRLFVSIASTKQIRRHLGSTRPPAPRSQRSVNTASRPLNLLNLINTTNSVAAKQNYAQLVNTMFVWKIRIHTNMAVSARHSLKLTRRRKLMSRN